MERIPSREEGEDLGGNAYARTKGKYVEIYTKNPYTITASILLNESEVEALLRYLPTVKGDLVDKKENE